MSKYATENVLSQYVQWVGNNGTGATQSTYKLQRAIFWWLTKRRFLPTPGGWTRGGGGGWTWGRKQQESQENGAHTGSWCLDKAVLPRGTKRTYVTENLPIPHQLAQRCKWLAQWFKKKIVLPPPLVKATQKYGINTVPMPTVA